MAKKSLRNGNSAFKKLGYGNGGLSLAKRFSGVMG